MSTTIQNPASSSFSTVKDQVLYNESNGEVMTIQNGMVISVDHPLPRPANFVGPARRPPIVNAPAETPYIAPTMNYGDQKQEPTKHVSASPTGNKEEQPYEVPTMKY